jgi:hypothetical protein
VDPSIYQILLDPIAVHDSDALVALDVPAGTALGDLAEVLIATLIRLNIAVIAVVVDGQPIGPTTRLYLEAVFSPGFTCGLRGVAGVAGANETDARGSVRYRCFGCGLDLFRWFYPDTCPPVCPRDARHGEMARR